MGLLTWMAVGLVAGFLAELVLGGGPGGIGPRRILLTGAVGVMGAVVGGFISTQLGHGDVTGFDIRSLLIAGGGAVLVIVTWRLLAKITRGPRLA